MKKKHSYKTLEDVIRAMLAGVVFYNVGTRLVFKKTSASHGMNPFRYLGNDSNAVMQRVWNNWTSWKVEAQWYEDIPEGGVLCWVSDECKADKNRAYVIVSYMSGEFSTCPHHSVDDIWVYATPVKPEECYEEI